MGSQVSKRSSTIPITVSHPSLFSYDNSDNDHSIPCISTVAMALSDSSGNLKSQQQHLQHPQQQHPQQQQQQQQQHSSNRPKMSQKSSQTSPTNRANGGRVLSSQNLSHLSNTHSSSPTSGVYSVAKQHQSLQVKPRMGRSSLALDDNGNFLAGSTTNLRKSSLDTESSNNSDDLNNNPSSGSTLRLKSSTLSIQKATYIPPSNEFITKIDHRNSKLFDCHSDDEDEDAGDVRDDVDVDSDQSHDDDGHDDVEGDSEDYDDNNNNNNELESNDNQANASKLLKQKRKQNSKQCKPVKGTKSSSESDKKKTKSKKESEKKSKEKSHSIDDNDAAAAKRDKKKIVKEEKKKRDSKVKKMKRSKRSIAPKRGRSSPCISVVFFFELCSIIGLGLFAALLRFTATFDIVDRQFDCHDSELSKNVAPTIKPWWWVNDAEYVGTSPLAGQDEHSLTTTRMNETHSGVNRILFSDFPQLMIHAACLVFPLALVFLVEFLRGIIGFLLLDRRSTLVNVEKSECRVRALHCIPIAPGVRRFFRFAGGFLLGMFVTSILCDALKHQTGELRPTFLNTCSQLQEFCAGNNNNNNNSASSMLHSTTDVKNLCFESDFRFAQTRFPSLTGAFATFAIGFTILYISSALPYRGLRFIRIWAHLALLLVYVFLLNAQVQSNLSLPIDLFVGALIAITVLLLVVLFHLNSFATRISTSDFMPSNRFTTTGSSYLNSLNSAEQGGAESDNVSDVEYELDDLSSHYSGTGAGAGLATHRDREWFWKSYHIPRVHTLRQSARALLRKTGYRPATNATSSGASGTGSSATSPQASTLPVRKAAYINPVFVNCESDYLAAETRFNNNTAGR